MNEDEVTLREMIEYMEDMEKFTGVIQYGSSPAREHAIREAIFDTLKSLEDDGK